MSEKKKVEGSRFLRESKPALKHLLGILLSKYGYASILAVDMHRYLQLIRRLRYTQLRHRASISAILECCATEASLSRCIMKVSMRSIHLISLREM